MESPGVRSLCGKCGAPLPPGGGPCEQCRRRAARPSAPRKAAARRAEPGLQVLHKGDVLDGKWRLEGKLGSGGMATVFLARDLNLDRLVAIKVLSRELCLDTEFIERFEREARLTAKLEHPNIVPVHAVGRIYGRPFMVMKRLEGATLCQLLFKLGRLPPTTACAIFRQVCAGLGHVHANGCIHRDIKASNVFVGSDHRVTLLDFGVLRDLKTKGQTRTGAMLGTPRYMSPEQARGAVELDHRADLYALGVLLFECLTGSPPFDAESDLGIIMKHAQAEPPDLAHLAPELPPKLAPMLQKALAKEPEGRFQSAGEFLAALEVALSQAPAVETPIVLGVPVEPEPPPEPPAQPGPAAPPKHAADPDDFDPGAFLSGEPDPSLATATPAPSAPDPTPPPVLPPEEPEPRAARQGRGRWLLGLAALAVLGLAGSYLWSHVEIRLKSDGPAAPAPEVPAVAVLAAADAAAALAEDAADAVDVGGPTDDAGEVALAADADAGSEAADASVESRDAAARDASSPAPELAVGAPRKAPAAAVPPGGLGRLKVTSVLSGQQYGALIEIDGVEQGETPATLSVPAGRHVVTVTRVGFQPVRATVVIRPRQTTTFQADLIP